jgi:hypothetical protein
MKITRDILWRDPRERHRLLTEPMRANQIAKGKRQRWIKEQTQVRFEALFAEYHIPTEWPELYQWQWLAMGLAGKLYQGCRTIERGLGGPQKLRRLDDQAQKRSLFEKFNVFRPRHCKLNAVNAAKLFMQKNMQACDAVRLRTPRSFLKARRSLSKES